MVVVVVVVGGAADIRDFANGFVVVRGDKSRVPPSPAAAAAAEDACPTILSRARAR